jgi:hypothetical protein
MAAGLGFKTFVTGEVLTAADTNGYLMQGVLVFATAAARDSAITSPQEGQYAFLKDSDSLVYYSGSAWVSASGSSGALTFINGASFSAVASVSAANNSFTTTYDNYRVIFQLSAAATTAALSLRFRASGTDSSAANYYSAQNRYSYLGSRSDTAQSGATSFDLGNIDSGNPGYTQYVFDFITPQLAQFSNININGGNNVATSVTGLGVFNASTQFDAFSLIKASGTMTGKYRIYGYQNS